MTSVQLMEQIGRDKTVHMFPTYQFTESPYRYDVWDMSGVTVNMAGNEKPYLIEIKDRKKDSTEYDSVYLQIDKYQELMRLAELNNIEDVFYISHFADNVTYIFNIKKFKIYDFKFEVRMNAKTYGSTEMVERIYIKLPYQNGKKYKTTK